MGLFSRKKKHPMHKQLEEYKKKKREREVKTTYNKAKHRGALKRAKTEGYKAGIGGKSSWMKGASDFMGDLSELMVGDFTFAPKPSRPVTQKRPQRKHPKAVNLGGKTYLLVEQEKKRKKPKKKKEDSLWDLI